MKVFIPHTDVLPPAQRALLPLLGPAAALGLTLYGGTAIALHVGHRQSVDFDFFIEHTLDRARLLEAMPFLSSASVLQDEPDTFTVEVVVGDLQGPAVKVSFFGSTTFGRVGEPEVTNDGLLVTASPLDLLGTKLKVMLQRAEAKDYQDVAALLRHGVRLEDGLGAARALYGKAFQPQEALRALTYFEGGDVARLVPEDRDLLARTVASAGMVSEVAVKSRTLGAPGTALPLAPFDSGPRAGSGDPHPPELI